ncbi:MAG: hypothetical protein UU32_C0037G0011 [Candidatus Woesebacteria bacterium GW2011_GWB1_41_10]|uniref:Uncharacterized protein n=1 Tax=Candidatus Woesebacteria bacterium GW2011_GWB1_41_10 TaxID=1618577 RepID=A0A0G0XBP2_9BACT|nr:MAG: hypothetical protein UU32_C0037G0011 [Candidatus Woesebacteria bacterium GW2011_GWB1_41_10]
MRDLLNYLLKGILGEEKFDISESNEEGRTLYSIQTEDKNKGLIIGKGGRMISALRNILKVKATLEKRAVNLQVTD